MRCLSEKDIDILASLDIYVSALYQRMFFGANSKPGPPLKAHSMQELGVQPAHSNNSSSNPNLTLTGQSTSSQTPQTPDLKELIRSLVPIDGFAAVRTALDRLQAELPVFASKEEVIGELQEIEENINNNMDTIVESLETLIKKFEASRAELRDKFTDVVSITEDKKLVLISNEKYAELNTALSQSRVSSKQSELVNKKIVKDNLAQLKEIKGLKDRLEEANRELQSMREKESKQF